MNTRRNVTILALTLAIMTTVALNTQDSSAIGGFLNKIKKDTSNQATTEATTDDSQASADKQKPANSEPKVFENTKYNFKFTYPGDWDLKDDDPKKSTVSVTDLWGNKGTFIAHAIWMSDDFPVEPAFQALIKKAEDRKKHGELDEYYVKNYTVKKDGKDVGVVKGVVVIESDIDPDYKRMQWEAYGFGNYYNFMSNSTVANFQAYKDKFKEMIESIEFNAPSN